VSKYGQNVGGENMFGVSSFSQALDWIEKIVDQYFGELWTQHRPRCPLCNEELHDCQKNMNRPVGECINEKCQSTIYPGDFFGKIRDVLDEVKVLREAEEEKRKKAEEEEERKKRATKTTSGFQQHKQQKLPATSASTNANVDDEDVLYVW